MFRFEQVTRGNHEKNAFQHMKVEPICDVCKCRKLQYLIKDKCCTSKKKEYYLILSEIRCIILFKLKEEVKKCWDEHLKKKRMLCNY